MKKINLVITGLVITLSLGLNTFTESQQQSLNRGDGGGAPARTDYINIAHGDYPAPAYNRGDGGGAPAYSVDDYNNVLTFDHGRPPMVNTHANL